MYLRRLLIIYKRSPGLYANLLKIEKKSNKPTLEKPIIARKTKNCKIDHILKKEKSKNQYSKFQFNFQRSPTLKNEKGKQAKLKTTR